MSDGINDKQWGDLVCLGWGLLFVLYAIGHAIAKAIKERGKDE